MFNLHDKDALRTIMDLAKAGDAEAKDFLMKRFSLKVFTVVPGDMVIHPEFGQGKVVQVLGDTAVVNFFGEDLDVHTNDLTVLKSVPNIKDNTNKERKVDKTAFRRSFEAINLGVVPPDPLQLIDLTIGAKELKKKVSAWLGDAPHKGLCKVIFGYYGSGKSHMLKFIRCMSLDAGWAVAYLEFDPKAADPAKPHLIYQNLMSVLEFPEREDGRRSEGFFGFIKEVREYWNKKNIRLNTIFRSSPWFSAAFEILTKYPHFPDVPEYRDACLWLAGNHNSYQTINRLAKNKGLPVRVPRMPVTREVADIYVFHLVVVNELCKLLGYRGLVIILDEAEHVRSYNVKRKARAINLFDYLSRAAHIPKINSDEPMPNEYGVIIPRFWEMGPHFSVFVGMTEADTFTDPTLSLNEACVFLRDEADRVILNNPSREDYIKWCKLFLRNFCSLYPLEMKTIENKNIQEQVIHCIAESYPAMTDGLTLRNLIKFASLAPCILLSHPDINVDSLLCHLRATSSNYLRNELPWES